MTAKPLSQHNSEIARNAKSWESKPLLRSAYVNFYKKIATALGTTDGEDVLEIGSGIGAIKTVLPKCTTSDIFENPWLDRVENAYDLNYPQASLQGIVLFDVWHHLQYPGSALKEFSRVLKPGGKVILFEPAMGLTGRFVYGLFHHEPLGFADKIHWEPDDTAKPTLCYYAAQGNCWRMFRNKSDPLKNYPFFKNVHTQVFSAVSYIASGGFSKPQLYPAVLFPLVQRLEKVLDKAPSLFATRMLVVLEKTG